MPRIFKYCHRTATLLSGLLCCCTFAEPAAQANESSNESRLVSANVVRVETGWRSEVKLKAVNCFSVKLNTEINHSLAEKYAIQALLQKLQAANVAIGISHCESTQTNGNLFCAAFVFENVKPRILGKTHYAEKTIWGNNGEGYDDLIELFFILEEQELQSAVIQQPNISAEQHQVQLQKCQMNWQMELQNLRNKIADDPELLTVEKQEWLEIVSQRQKKLVRRLNLKQLQSGEPK